MSELNFSPYFKIPLMHVEYWLFRGQSMSSFLWVLIPSLWMFPYVLVDSGDGNTFIGAIKCSGWHANDWTSRCLYYLMVAFCTTTQMTVALHLDDPFQSFRLFLPFLHFLNGPIHSSVRDFASCSFRSNVVIISIFTVFYMWLLIDMVDELIWLAVDQRDRRYGI